VAWINWYLAWSISLGPGDSSLFNWSPWGHKCHTRIKGTWYNKGLIAKTLKNDVIMSHVYRSECIGICHERDIFYIHVQCNRHVFSPIPVWCDLLFDHYRTSKENLVQSLSFMFFWCRISKLGVVVHHGMVKFYIPQLGHCDLYLCDQKKSLSQTCVSLIKWWR